MAEYFLNTYLLIGDINALKSNIGDDRKTMFGAIPLAL